MTNPTMPNVLKIGMTTLSPELRAKQLSAPTGVPTPFEVAYQRKVSNCRLVERLVHGELSKYRLEKNKEFFIVPLKEAKLTVDKISKGYKPSSSVIPWNT